jgi:hypothetical protein
MSKHYIENNFDDIEKYSSTIENRSNDDGCYMESVIKDNAHYFTNAKLHNASIIFIDDSYDINFDLF